MFGLRNISVHRQYLIGFLLVLLLSVICFFLTEIIGYKIVALLLLMTTSFIAMLFDILPVLFAAALSALIWNFFFIPPIFTFHVDNTEDLLMFSLYFIIALVNGVLTFKIHKAEKEARDREEKENTIKLYGTLLNSLSHELRTPISAILGAVDTLKENPKLAPESGTALLSEIDKASLRLNQQVENLLNMSRLESGTLKPNIDWCDMSDLVSSVIQKLPTANNHKIIFQAEDNLPLFKVDSGFTEQALYNLLHNAVQYTPENSTIVIDVKYQTGNCVIVVSDNGNGFPEDKIALVFDKFYRLPNTKAGGSGLGLSIVKGFIEAQNGTIKLENHKQGGAVFTIQISAETSYLNNLKNE